MIVIIIIENMRIFQIIVILSKKRKKNNLDRNKNRWNNH
jgi:hypothetical protein